MVVKAANSALGSPQTSRLWEAEWTDCGRGISNSDAAICASAHFLVCLRKDSVRRRGENNEERFGLRMTCLTDGISISYRDASRCERLPFIARNLPTVARRAARTPLRSSWNQSGTGMVSWAV